MGKFIKHYALEIYTVISLGLLLAGTLMDNLSVIQKFVMVFNMLFILHEWEEMHYPGGFVNLIARMLRKDVSLEQKLASRIPTSILLMAFTFVPFFWDDCVIFILVTATLGIFEGYVHLMAIRLFRLPKFYSPGLITAELELLVSIVLIVWLEHNNLASASDYILGGVIMFGCFIAMQKTLTMMIGVKYSELPKLIRKQWSK
jgi:hypothetical protein